MKKEKQRKVFIALGYLLAFVLWTLLVRFSDVKEIGPKGTAVGFATVNSLIHELTGVHMMLYIITDWLGFVPVGFMTGFSILGVVQWVKRKKISKIDFSIIALGGLYFVTMVLYVFFEILVVNYRPILINGLLEASYLSSTTMLTFCVMPTAVMQLNERIKNKTMRKCISAMITVFSVFMVTARLVSGVHWFSDIVGGTLLSAGLVMLYRALTLSH